MTTEPMTDVEMRFWDKARIGDGCWEWQGFRREEGYGMFKVRRAAGWRSVNAHRVAYELANGPIPDGLQVCHRCDNPRCVRPGHLFLGTAADNNADKVAKGRQARGESINANRVIHRGAAHWQHTKPERAARGDRNGTRRHPEIVQGSRNGRAKLSEATVVQIRERLAAGEKPAALAAAYGVGRTTISEIALGKKWRHV